MILGRGKNSALGYYHFRSRLFSHLRFDQDEINEENDKVVLDIFVGESLAARALCQSDSLSQGSIVSFAVGRVEMLNWSTAADAYWHHPRGQMLLTR